MKNPIVTILMNSGNKIVIELYPKEAPNSINCFIDLVQRKLFDEREIKRIVPGFVIQPTYTSFDRHPDTNVAVDGEFRANGFENHLKLEKGVVALGGDGKTMSGVSCFFITMSDESGARLDGKYTGIGRVIEGMEEVERIEKVELIPVITDTPGVTVNEPKVPEIMKLVTVETFGVEYPKPIISGIAD